MRVTFVYPDVMDLVPDFPGAYYVGVGSLSAFLRARGHETSLVHLLRHPEDRRAFLNQLRTHEPDVVAFSSTTLQFRIVQTVSQWIKEEWPECVTVCGGVHPSIMPEKALESPGLDIVCVGDGEEALATLCERLSRNETILDISNLWIKQAGQIHPNPPALPLTPLDDLPFPDRDIFDYESLYWEREGTAVLMASRGCPYSCNYCCNKALREIYPGKVPPFRLRDVDKVIEEILQIKRDFPFVKSLNFDDDIFFLNKAWARTFAEKYEARVGLPFHCNIRPNVVDEEVVSLMKRANCREVRVGLESGDDRIRNSVLNRGLSREQILSACRAFKSAGIDVRTFNMIGIPEETPREVLETIKINAEAGIDFPQYTIFYPFPGTPLFYAYREQGILPSREMTDYFVDTSLELPHLPREQLQMFREYFLRILKFYRVLYRFPSPVRLLSVRVADRFFRARQAPKVMKGMHRVLRMIRVLSGSRNGGGKTSSSITENR